MKTAESNCILNSQKQTLRKFYSDLRKDLGEIARREKSGIITKHLLSMDDVVDGDVVMAYHSIGSEVNTYHLMREIIDSGRSLVLPYCLDDKGMGIARVYNLETDIEKGPFGTLQPKRSLWDNINIEKINVCICPGVAFHKFGTRLGRGGGFYDSFLHLLKIKSKAVIIGCCFECQISEDVLPKEHHDIDMDFVVSESGRISLESTHIYQTGTFHNIGN
ncbi:MAG: 5-formyltetrahydrofolate cyclo-ligase [Chitinispirillia bacterium]|nr:5-formyltetrahydrofolate cyclo-ligase [Chitinispirillia bacterium]